MSRIIDTSQWITFFSKAGLPPNVAANYALIFSDNRIQLDMLLDLSKEYLYDMGIKIMGDVIAILRYAKEFHTQLSKERIFGGSKPSPSKTAVAERMVGHYTRRFSPVQSPVQSRLTPPQKPKIISLKRKNTEETEVKKIRRVPPEEEGAYKIKMPSGTTERTRQILQKQKKVSLGTKRSVFSRLGDSAVSSSTDTNKNAGNAVVSSSVFERLGPNKMSSDDIPTSTVISDVDLKKRNAPLPYKGVLKMTVGKNRTVVSTSPMKGNIGGRTVIKPRQNRLQNVNITKTVRLNQINSILTGNQATTHTQKRLGTGLKSQGLFGGAISHRLGVKGRLGNTVTNSNVKNKILLSKIRVANKSSSNVFDRLGR